MDCFLLCTYHLLLAVTLHSSEPVTLSGFLVQNAQGQWYLVPEPNLKTCCIGSKHKAHEQVLVLGEFPKELHNHFTHLKGTLDKRQGISILENATLVGKRKSVPYVTLSLFAAVCFAFVFLSMKRTTS